MVLKSDVCRIPLSESQIGLVSLYTGKKVVLSKNINSSIQNNSVADNMSQNLSEVINQFYCDEANNDLRNKKEQSKKTYYRLINDTSNMNLYLIPNRKCNFACKYCFMDDNITSSELNDEVLTELISWIKNQCKCNNHKKVAINLYGGEPFYKPALTMHIMNSINSALAIENIKVSYAAATNGFNISLKNIDDLVCAGLNCVTITLDGTPAVHNNRRPLRNSSIGTYEIICEHIKQIMNKVNVNLNVVLDKDNFSSIDEMFSSLKKENILDNVYVSITPMSNHCNQDFANNNKIEDNEFEMLINALSIASKYDITLAKPFPSLSPCFRYMRHGYAIDYNGDIYDCPGGYGVKDSLLGNVRDNHIAEKKIDFTKWEKCWGCKYIYLCGGKTNKNCTENVLGKNVQGCKKALYDDFIPKYLRKVIFSKY